MKRTQNRPLATGRLEPRAALMFAVTLEVAAFVFLWATVNLLSAVLAVSACLFYVFVYTLWLKRTSKHNIVIGGAAGRRPGAHRLVGGHRLARLGAGRAVRRHLLLDPAALLGPRHPLPRRLRRRRRADAAGRWPACGRPPADPALHAAAVGAHAAVRAGGRTWAPLRGAALVLGAVFTWYAVRLVRDRDPRWPCGCSRGRSPTSRCCSAPWPSTSCSGRAGRWPTWLFRGLNTHVTRFPSTARLLTRVRS